MSKLASITSLVAATAVSQAFGRFTYSVLYIEIRDDFDLSNTLAGSIGSLNLVGYLLGSLLVAYTIGNLGLVRTARHGLLGVIIGLLLLTWAPNMAVVTFALFLTGLAAAGVWVTAPALATKILGVEKQGLAVGWVTAGVGLGFFFACVFDAALQTWRSVYQIEALLGITTFALLYLSIKTSEATSSQSGISPAALRQIPGWLNLCLTYGLFAIAVSLTLTFSAALLEDDAGFKEQSASLVFALIGLGLALGGPTVGWLADRIGRKATQLASLASLIASCVLITTGLPFVAPAGTLLFGIAFTGVVVNITTKVSSHLDGEAFGAAYAVLTIVFAAGLAVGPQLGGIIADSSGSFRPALLLSAACGFCALCLTFKDLDLADRNR